MINRILGYFGLMKISRAENLTLKLHQFYVGAVLDGLKKDFGVGALPSSTLDAERWWRGEFEAIIKPNEDDLTITNKPKYAS